MRESFERFARCKVTECPKLVVREGQEMPGASRQLGEQP